MPELPPLCAQALRDGGIDATAALDHALSIALAHAPQEFHPEMKLAVGKAMAAVMEQMLAPAIRAYPALEPSDDTWRAVALERARARSAPPQGQGHTP